MESNINKLSMREILNKIGFPVTINEFRNTYKFNVDLNTAMEFESRLKQITKMSDIQQIVCRYEDIFDKEIYVFHMARLLEKDIENIKRAELLDKEAVGQLVFTNDITGKNKRRFFVNAKNLLRNCDVIDIVMKKKTKGEFEIYSSMDFIAQNTEFSDKMEIEAFKKLEKIEEKIGLQNVVEFLKNSDISDICRYPNLAILLTVSQEKLEKKIRKYIQYIDLNKMLVLANAVYFYKYGEDLYKFSKEEVANLKSFTKAVSEIVGNSVQTLQTTRFYFTINYNDIKEKVKNLSETESSTENDNLIENVNNVNEEEIREVENAEEVVEELEKEEIETVNEIQEKEEFETVNEMQEKEEFESVNEVQEIEENEEIQEIEMTEAIPESEETQLIAETQEFQENLNEEIKAEEIDEDNLKDEEMSNEVEIGEELEYENIEISSEDVEEVVDETVEENEEEVAVTENVDTEEVILEESIPIPEEGSEETVSEDSEVQTEEIITD